jgi:hypothetical protein
VRLGDELIAKARRHNAPGGWSWGMTAVIPEVGLPPDRGGDLVGYSHGTAGIATGLLELHAISGEARFREAAAQALAYERGVVQPGRAELAGPEVIRRGATEPARLPRVVVSRRRQYRLRKIAIILADR